MLKLVAIFKNSGGKSHTWSFNNPDTNNTPAQIKGLLERIGALNLFHSEGLDLFDTVESAKFVETIETEIF